MAYKSLFDGILFVEGFEENIQVLGPVEYKKDLSFNQQLKNLDDVKRQLVEAAKNMGANAIINFEYGQKTIGFWKSIVFSRDDNVNWYAKGLAVIIDSSRMEEIIEKIKSR